MSVVDLHISDSFLTLSPILWEALNVCVSGSGLCCDLEPTGELTGLHIRVRASVLLSEHRRLECAPSFS